MTRQAISPRFAMRILSKGFLDVVVGEVAWIWELFVFVFVFVLLWGENRVDLEL